METFKWWRGHIFRFVLFSLQFSHSLLMIEEYFRDDMCQVKPFGCKKREVAGIFSFLPLLSPLPNPGQPLPEARNGGLRASQHFFPTAAAMPVSLPSCWEACGDEAQRSDRHRGRGKSLVLSVGKKGRRFPVVLPS